MQPTRRRCLAVAGAGLGAGVAGCLSSGSNVTYPEADDAPDESTNESAGDDGGDEEPVDPINSRLAEETAPIYAELRWFETEYDDAMLRYKGRLREVYEAVNSLRATLEEDGRISAGQLSDVEELADEVAGSVNRIPEPQFTNHIAFQKVNDERFEKIRTFRQREDWDRVDAELRRLGRVYGNASTDARIRERYSPNPVDNRLYEWLAPGEGRRLFEFRHVSDDPTDHEDRGRLPGHGLYVVDDSRREIEDLDRPLGGPRWELFSGLEGVFEPFSESAGRRYRLFGRLHDISELDEEETIDDDASIDPQETDSVTLFAQEFADTETAAAAHDAVMTDKATEGEDQWGDETWKQVLYDYDGDRYYAHFLRADAFLFAVNPTQTAWEERDEDEDEDEDDNDDDDSWTDPIDGTWLNPNP
ncbi:hypothetical protein [Halohasta salina]|uniref:hypothetical protein n=1 Tax=Halohasta salina TaxID=2961621 RepID=UPI0020A308BB|nr:hypothetical protein [Halohasta salina]